MNETNREAVEFCIAIVQNKIDIAIKMQNKHHEEGNKDDFLRESIRAAAFLEISNDFLECLK